MDSGLPTLFSDHVAFRAKFQQYWDTVRAENLDYLSVFYTLMGYFSTMKTNNIYDQVSADHMDILKILIAGHRDRFFLLLIGRRSTANMMTGRLLYFHMNDRAPFFDHNSLYLDDLQIILDSLKYYDPSLTELEQGLWVSRIRETCLYVRMNIIQPTDQNLNFKFKVATSFVRVGQFFQPSKSGMPRFRELSMSNIDLSQRTILNDLSTTFRMLYDSFKQNTNIQRTDKLLFHFNKANFLNFIRGALFFNSRNLEVTPMYAGEKLEKLAILIHDESRWITSHEPILVEIYRSNDEKFEGEHESVVRNLPIGHGTTAREAKIVSVTVSMDQKLNVDVRRAEIFYGHGLLDFLDKLTKLDVGSFTRSHDHFRREILVHLDRIDTFLGHQHKVEILRHYFQGLLMVAVGNFDAYKLRNTFDPTNPIDTFLIRSEDNGILITLSSDLVDNHVSDTFSDHILKTGLRKLVVLNLINTPYSLKSRDGETINPVLGVLDNDTPFANLPPTFDSSHWLWIKTKFGPNFIPKLLLRRSYQSHSVYTKWGQELRHHSMIPRNRAEFSANVKGMIPEYAAFRPYGTDFVGFTIKKFGYFINTFKISDFAGNYKSHFNLILDMQVEDQNDALLKLKQFFKTELSSSFNKLNTGLAKLTLTSNEEGNSQLAYSTSFPNGENKEEYKSCYTRRKRSGKYCLSNFGEKEKPRYHKIHGIINTAMYLQMIKGMIGSTIDGDYEKLASEAGIIAGMVSMSFIGDQSIRWGQSIMKSGNMLKGSSLHLGGRILSKAYLGFVISDLVTRVEAFEQDEDQIVGIVGDSAILTINTVSTGVEIFSTFASVEEASLELGPEVMIGEAIIFAIIDGFYATKSVKKIEQEIALSWGEKFVQWCRSFFGAHRSQYLDELIREKMLLQKNFDQMIQKLELMNHTFQYYAAPSLFINDRDDVQQIEDNVIVMEKVISVESRVWPETSNDFKVECAYSEHQKDILEIDKFRLESDRMGFTTDGIIHKSIFCKNMVSASINTKNAETALTILSTGDDTAIGFKDKKNYFILGGGQKFITGGHAADTFMLTGNSNKVLGALDGQEGGNVLDLSQYLESEKLYIDMQAEKLIYSNNASLTLKGIENIIGRNGSSDRVVSSCRIRFLDLKGGKSDRFPDLIIINDQNCDQNLTIKLSGYVNVNNFANNSDVLFLVQNGTNAKIHTSTPSVFLLSTNLMDVDWLQYENNTLRIKSGVYFTKLVVQDSTLESKFIFSDQFQLTFADGYLEVMTQIKTINNPDSIKDYLRLSRKLSLMITLKTEQKVIHISNQNRSPNNSVIHFQNDPQLETNIILADNGKVYVELNASCDPWKIECQLKNVSVHVLDSSSLPQIIIDVSTTYTLFMANHQPLTLNIQNSTDSLLFDLKLKNRTFSTVRITYENFTLKSDFCTNVYLNIEALMKVCYEGDTRIFILRPMPLRVSKNDSILVLSEDDIVKNMEIMIDKQMTDLECRSLKNSLVFTNDLDLDQIDSLTIIFIDYFSSSNDTIHENGHFLFDLLIIRFENSRKNLAVSKVIQQFNFMVERLDF